MDRVDKRIKDARLNPNFLDTIFVGRCADDKRTCSLHSGDITDINIWNTALTIKEMIEWTNCRCVIHTHGGSMKFTHC